MGTATIAPSSVVRDLGIYLDSNLSMTAHISKTVSNCFSAMRLIRGVRRSVSKAVLLSLVTLLVLSRVDYGNATLAGCTPTLLAAVRPPRRCTDGIQCPEVRSRDSTAPTQAAFITLASGSGAERITFKLASLVFRCLNFTAARHQCTSPTA